MVQCNTVVCHLKKTENMKHLKESYLGLTITIEWEWRISLINLFGSEIRIDPLLDLISASLLDLQVWSLPDLFIKSPLNLLSSASLDLLSAPVLSGFSFCVGWFSLVFDGNGIKKSSSLSSLLNTPISNTMSWLHAIYSPSTDFHMFR